MERIRIRWIRVQIQGILESVYSLFYDLYTGYTYKCYKYNASGCLEGSSFNRKMYYITGVERKNRKQCCSSLMVLFYFFLNKSMKFIQCNRNETSGIVDRNGKMKVSVCVVCL